MLIIAKKLRELSFSRLMDVYIEGNLERECSIQEAEQSFYDYLAQAFFTVPGAVYYVWEEDGRYVSALRLEPYLDGLLLEALETAPDCRRRGYARRLMEAVLERLPDTTVYSHVNRRNAASLAVHEKCGFVRILDHAVYIDGSVLRSAVTLAWRKP